MAFSEPSLLLPGENHRDFEAIRQMMVDDIQLETNIEWLWTLDLVELSWEILRYRNLKNRILDAHRAAAIEAILQRLEGEGMPAEAMPLVQLQAKRGPRNGVKDPEAAIEIEARPHGVRICLPDTSNRPCSMQRSRNNSTISSRRPLSRLRS
jgi:hypothetical protein